jgi:hypothetical protein
MAISYNIYANEGQGDDVNYNAPIATTPLLTYVIPQLGFPSDNTFAVRAFDAISGIEEANTDARVRIVIDPSGNDVTAQPNSVFGLTAIATAGGTCWVAWGYDTTGQDGPPSGFNVFLVEVGTSSPGSLTATVAYLPGVAGYGCTLSGLTSNTSYTIEVQAIDVSGTLSSPAATATINYRVNPLSSVDSLVATPSA